MEIRLHPGSLLVGLGIAVLGFVAMGQQALPAIPDIWRVAVVRPIEVAPHPRDYVQVKEGVPYVVPTGKVLVLTALGGSTPAAGTYNYFARLSVDGVESVAASAGLYSGNANLGATDGGVSTMKELPLGLSASAGATVVVTDGNTAPDDARAWGFLADA